MVQKGTRGRPQGFCDRLIGYARVSTVAQDPALQIAALEAVGVERLYTDRLPGNAARLLFCTLIRAEAAFFDRIAR